MHTSFTLGKISRARQKTHGIRPEVYLIRNVFGGYGLEFISHAGYFTVTDLVLDIYM